MEKIKKQNKLILVLSIILAIIFSFMGGVKLLIYIFMFITGIFLGAKYTKFSRMYTDWKLALKVNTVLYSSKESETLRSQIEQLNGDLKMANERIKLYSSAMASKPQTGGFNNDNIISDRTTRLRENQLPDGERRYSE